MCAGNCGAQDMLLSPQWHYEWKLTLYFLWAYLKERGDRGKRMQLTAGLIGLKTSFFSSGFLGPLSWRCDGEPSDLDDAVCVKTTERNTEQNRLSRELKYIILLHFGVGKRDKVTIRQCLTARYKFHWFTIVLSLKDYAKTIISCNLYSCPMTEAKVNCQTVVNQRG